jgi:hypothetical protein
VYFFGKNSDFLNKIISETLNKFKNEKADRETLKDFEVYLF